jgi:hypothetical protein
MKAEQRQNVAVRHIGEPQRTWVAGASRSAAACRTPNAPSTTHRRFCRLSPTPTPPPMFRLPELTSHRRCLLVTTTAHRHQLPRHVIFPAVAAIHMSTPRFRTPGFTCLPTNPQPSVLCFRSASYVVCHTENIYPRRQAGTNQYTLETNARQACMC